jgi:hypothetical protein
MSRRITLRNEDHEWMVGIVEGMIRKANRSAGVWLEHMPQLERIKEALYTANPGFEELFPDEPAPPVGGNKRGRPAGVAPPPVGVRAEPAKPRAKRGERKATLPNLCKDHPAYGAVRPPRTDCLGCWAAFKKKKGVRLYEKAIDRFNAKRGVE